MSKLKLFVFIILTTLLSGGSSQHSNRKEVVELLERAIDLGKVEFTEYQSHAKYEASTAFSAKGMAPLYNGTHVVLNAVVGEKAVPDGFLTVKDGNFVVGDFATQWTTLASHYAFLIVIVILGLLIAILMPIIGFCFCCCRCAGSCGARTQPFDKKHDTCRRVILGLLLIGVATAMLFGVVVAFVTNSYMEDGIKLAPNSVRIASRDSVKYLESTAKHVRHILVDNFDEVQKGLEKSLDAGGAIISNELANVTGAVSLNQLERIVTKLPDVKETIKIMKVTSNSLRVNASQLNDGLRRVKRELLKTLNSCTQDACKDVLRKYKIGELDTSGIDFNQLPDPSELYTELNNLVNEELQSDLQNSLQEFKKIQTDLEKSMNDSKPAIITSVNKAGNEIQNHSDEIEKALEVFVDLANDHTEIQLAHAQRIIDEYFIYRYYIGLGLSAILLVILLCTTLGLLCGICGKRPDGYGDDCCNKGAGSTFLMCGVGLMFLTTTILAAFALIYFVIGLVAYRGVCVPLNNPANDQLFSLVDELLNIGDKLYSKDHKDKLVLSDIIEDCRTNKTIYTTLKMQNILDLDTVTEYIDKFGIHKTLSELMDDFKLDGTVQIMNDVAKDRIRELQTSSLSDFPFYKYVDNLGGNITNYNLAELADKLADAANKLPPSYKPEVGLVLRNQALHLRSYQDNLVDPMISSSKYLSDKAAELDVQLKFGHNNFNEAIDKVIEEVTHAEDELNNEGTLLVKKLIRTFAEGIETNIKDYFSYIVGQLKFKVGICGPVANVYDSILVAGCNRILDPFNGFWAGVGWCILLFIPCIILSVKLSGLYQKSDPYPGPLVESEYLYDAYADRDNISLTSAPADKRRKGKNRGPPRPEPQGQGPSASQSDDRYRDMAPKHWDDYPEGAPPRYHSPPLPPLSSEYERPPPYYYPGPTADRTN